MHLSSALRDMRLGTGQLARDNTDSRIWPHFQRSTHWHRVQFHFLYGNSKAQAVEKIQTHNKACAWAEDPAQTPPLSNTCFQLKSLSCPVPHVPFHIPARRSNSWFFFLCLLSDCTVSVLLSACGSGIGQETWVGRSGGVSVKCFTNKTKIQVCPK